MTSVVTEGLAKLVIEGENGTESFYNPVMQFNRDLTVTILRQFVEDRQQTASKSTENSEVPRKKRKIDAHANNPIKILDALSASGLRAIRFSKEVPNVKKVVANDFAEASVKNIQRNVQENGLEDVIEVTCDDAKLVMMKNTSFTDRFDVIDLDPYGSASIFLDAAVQSVADEGLLMVTCTDMAVLCGNTPEACYLKYNAVGLRHPSTHELALRILLRAIDSRANVYGRYIEPLLSVSVDYYVRVFVKIHTSPSKAKLSASKISNVLACSGCRAFELQPILKTTDLGHSNLKFSPAILKPGLMNDNKCCHCNSPIHIGGPIYSAPIQNMEFVNKILTRLRTTPENERLGTHDRLIGILTVISEELNDVPLYLVQDQLMSMLKLMCPKQTTFRSILLNAGYKVSGTHCNPKGFKTNAPMDFVLDIPRSLVNKEKIEKMSPIGQAIMEKEITHKLDDKFHPASVPSSVTNCLVRFQHNRGKNWGPKSKAKGSVNTNFPSKTIQLDEIFECDDVDVSEN